MLPLPTSTRFAETGLASSSGRLFRVQAFREYEHRVARCRHTRWHCNGRPRLRNRQNACPFNLSRARAGCVHGSNSAAEIGLGHVQVQVVGCERTVLLGEVPHRARMRFSVTSRRPGGVGQPPRQAAGHYGECLNWANALEQPPARLRGGLREGSQISAWSLVSRKGALCPTGGIQNALFRETSHSECVFP